VPPGQDRLASSFFCSQAESTSRPILELIQIPMSMEEKIIRALKQNRPECANLDEQHLEHIQEGVYHLHTTPPYFLKWIPNDDRLGQNEIWVNQTILQKCDFPTPHLKFTIKLEEGAIACWEWLDGIDLRHQHRDYLPQAFAQLGRFHTQQRHDHTVYSLITHHGFVTIKELLKAELDFLCTYHDASIVRKAKAAFSLLELGYPTYIHGDMHPGNIRLVEKSLKFVDWGYCISSLNLFDLGYIETVHFQSAEENGWWNIAPDEAKTVLPAYFEASGLDRTNIDQIQQAVMLWSKLWSYYNCVKNDKKTEAVKCKRDIGLLEIN
jgi:thiamine kinase-like enzyme